MAVHTNPPGSPLFASRYSSMAAISDGTEPNASRRMALSSRSRNHRTTILSHELDVGVKCRWKRGCFSSHAFTFGCLWVA